MEDERSQWRIEPSEPPDTSIGCTGCHVTATLRKVKFKKEMIERIGSSLTANFLLVPLESSEFLHSTDVEYPDCLVTRCTRNKVTVRRP